MSTDTPQPWAFVSEHPQLELPQNHYVGLAGSIPRPDFDAAGSGEEEDESDIDSELNNGSETDDETPRVCSTMTDLRFNPCLLCVLSETHDGLFPAWRAISDIPQSRLCHRI